MCLLQFYLLRLCPSVRQWNCPSWNPFFDWFKGDYRQINNNKKKKNLKVTTSTKFCECLQKGYEEIKTDPHFTKRISEPTAETQPLMFSMYSLGEVIYPYCASVSSFLKCVGGGLGACLHTVSWTLHKWAWNSPWNPRTQEVEASGSKGQGQPLVKRIISYKRKKSQGQS